jgi:hypothetical protein
MAEEHGTQFALGPGTGLAMQLAEGCPSGFEPQRNRFVAAAADRLVNTRAFVPLTCGSWFMTAADRARLVHKVSLTGIPVREASSRVEAFLRVAVERGEALEEELADRNEITPDEIMTALETAFTDAMSTSRGGEPEEKVSGPRIQGTDSGSGSLWSLAFGGLHIVPQPELGPDAQAGQLASLGGVQAVEPTPAGYPLAILGGITWFFNTGWLGILHYDRMRLRPSGLVAGEQVYSLALSPGEEVTYTQSSETKRSRSFEDVLTQSAERELEFNSTWATTLSQQDVDTTGRNAGGSLSYGVPVNLGGTTATINGSTNASNASTSSSTAQGARNRQLTGRLTARAREEHKTTFRVSTETTEEFGSKRTVRNTNPSHAVTLNFFKLHQKHRVILERYDAKLAFSFSIDDPGRELRAELEDELAKLEPHVPADACPSPSQAQTVSEDHTFANPGGLGNWSDQYIFSTILPGGTVLAGWDFEILDASILGFGGPLPVTADLFRQLGGVWSFAGNGDIPAVGSSGFQRHVINVRWSIAVPVVQVRGRFSWTYAPDSAAIENARACIEAAEAEIRRSFSMDRLLAVVEEIDRGRTDLLFKRLIEQLLPGFYLQGVDPPTGLLDVVRGLFDWNEAYVEYLPWWMTTGGRTRREALRQRLLKLPGDVRSDWVIDDRLIASTARVVLPIKASMEKQAIRFLTQLKGDLLNRLFGCVDDFLTWRQENLGALGPARPSYTEVMSPASAVGTPAGAADWVHDWERPQRRFIVLDEWSELLPTDGVHVEPALSACGSADALRTSALVSDLQTAAARRDLEDAHATLERALADRDEATTIVVIGDPASGLG